MYRTYRFAALLAALLLAGCGTTDPTLPLAGTYTLESVAGAQLPIDASFVDGFDAPNARELRSGTLTLHPSGEWFETRVYVGRYGPFTVQAWGTWTGSRLDGRAGAAQLTRTRAGLEVERADSLLRYRSTN